MVSIGEIEEDISERMLGRLVSKSDAPTRNNNKKNVNTSGIASSTAVVESDASSSSATLQQSGRSESIKSDASTNTTVQQNRGGSESNKMGKQRVRKNGRFSRSTSPRTSSRVVDTTPAAPPASNTLQQQNAAEQKTARKARKTVAKVQPPLPPPPAAPAAAEHANNIHQRVHTTRAATRSAGSTVALFRGIEDLVIPPKKQTPKVSASNSKNDGSVVKVQMLTGVLYLYRDGGKRRARFVRTK